MAIEIERKFLVCEIPFDLSEYKSFEITQGYISFTPEIRIRKKGHEFIYTEKGEGDVSRPENNKPINEEKYEILRNAVQGNLIEKTRYEIPLGNNLTAELDIYHGQLEGLITVEVEFDTHEDEQSFIAPDWFGKDVTFDRRYKNKNLAQLPNISALLDKKSVQKKIGNIYINSDL